MNREKTKFLGKWKGHLQRTLQEKAQCNKLLNKGHAPYLFFRTPSAELVAGLKRKALASPPYAPTHKLDSTQTLLSHCHMAAFERPLRASKELFNVNKSASVYPPKHFSPFVNHRQRKKGYW